MITAKRAMFVFAVTALIAGATNVALVSSQESAETSLMQAKSDYAHRLLDALVVEDFGAVRDEAFRLKAVAETADWKAIESEAFVRQSEAFIRATDEIMAAAREENGDAVALAYMDLTLKCVHCHRLLRRADKP